MSQSMWSLSGRHWAGTLAAWFAFVLSVLALIGNSAPPAGAEPAKAIHGEASARLAFASKALAAGLEARAVSHTIKPLDLSKLKAEAFGDLAELPEHD